MNRNSYNRLPKDIQGIIDAMAENNEYGLIAAQGLDQLSAAGRKCFIEHGGKIVQWEPAALAEIERQFAPLWEKWITERESKNLPAKKAADVFCNSLAKQGVKNPAVGYRPARQ